MYPRLLLRSLLLFLPLAFLVLFAAACSPAPAPAPLETSLEEHPPEQVTATVSRLEITPGPTSPPPSATPVPAELVNQPAQPVEPTEDQPAAETQPEEAGAAETGTQEQDPGTTEAGAAGTGSSTGPDGPDEPAGPAEGNPAGPCQERVAFYGDVTIPDDTLFDQGAAFVKTWRVRNEGTCPWGPDYALVFIGGNSMGGPLSSPLAVVQPGEIVELSVNLAAPREGGTFVANYLLRNPSGQLFGVGVTGKGQLYTRIATKWLPSAESPVGGIAGAAPETAPGAETAQAEPAIISSTAIAGCQVERNGRFENAILDLFNRLRASLNLPPLNLEYRLSVAAFLHSQDMACLDHTEHTGSDGSSWDSRVAAQGYPSAYTLENIYAANPDFGGTPQYVYEEWYRSAIHYQNMTDPRVTEVGIGYVFSPDSRFKGYTTAVFARPEGDE